MKKNQMHLQPYIPPITKTNHQKKNLTQTHVLKYIHLTPKILMIIKNVHK